MDFENILEAYQGEYDTTAYQKAELLERVVARVIDFLIAGGLYFSLPLLGPLASVTYILIADGLKNGRSLGKRVAGVHVVSVLTDKPASFRDSIFRNSLFAFVAGGYFVFGVVPYIGKPVFILIGLGVLLCEVAILHNDEKKIRLGDRLAGTMVVQGSLSVTNKGLDVVVEKPSSKERKSKTKKDTEILESSSEKESTVEEEI
ncbi:MAG: RDD family protein [Deltaproteobacteria bacterium]|nr:RDD family protein [Deltaproteobacteria bacterium]